MSCCNFLPVEFGHGFWNYRQYSSRMIVCRYEVGIHLPIGLIHGEKYMFLPANANLTSHFQSILVLPSPQRSLK